MGMLAARMERDGAFGAKGGNPSNAVPSPERTDLQLHLLNLDEIAAAYGQGAALAAVNHVKCILNFELRDQDSEESAEYVLRQLSEVPVAYDGQRFHLFVSLAPTGGTENCAPKVTPTVHGNPAFPDGAWCRRYRADMALAVTLFEAMADDRLVLAWQAVRGAECSAQTLYQEGLLRIVDGAGALVSAGPLVEAAERLGLVRPLDCHVVGCVIEELKADRVSSLGVNISAQSLANDIWWVRHLDALARNPQMARRLYVEITETAQVPDIGRAADFAATLRGLGCRVVLDDFGVGHAAIRSVLSLSPDVVKIDRFFVRHAHASPAGWRALGHLIGLVHSLGALAIVEGVETAQESRMVAGLGARWQQGFHLGRPSLSRFAMAGAPETLEAVGDDAAPNVFADAPSPPWFVRQYDPGGGEVLLHPIAGAGGSHG